MFLPQGGSKFLESDRLAVHRAVIESNVKMYQVVFPWAAARGVPVVFTSSQLQATATSYGAVKHLGEEWSRAQPMRTRSVRCSSTGA